MLTPVRRVLFAIYCLSWLIVLGALTAEIAFVVERRFAREDVAAYRQANVFVQAREVAEAFEDSLWEIPWERYRPHASRVVSLGDSTYDVRINSHGYRTAEFDRNKPPRRLRVVCIGASTTVQGRTNATTYPAFLEALLRSSNPERDVEVLNLGISGTESNFWLERSGELTRLDPDVVVQYNAINDIAWRHLGYLALKHPARRTLNGSHVFQRLFPLDPSSLDDYFEKTFRNFEVLGRRLGTRGIDYVAGTFAFPSYAAAPRDFQRFLDTDAEERWGSALQLKTYSQLEALLVRYNAAFEGFAARAGLESASIHSKVFDPALFIDSCHMTEPGIEELARAFFPVVNRLLEERESAR